MRRVWEILSDFKPHVVKDIAAELGYKNHRSFDNTKIVVTMKELGLVEMSGKDSIQFTDKVPRLSTSDVNEEGAQKKEG